MSQTIILIPSRLNSKRLKNKPLLEIDGCPLVVHTYKRAEMSKICSKIYVCTDSKRLKENVRNFQQRLL